MTYMSHKLVPKIDQESHECLETATFCLGCFWGPDAEFGSMEGIVRTRVGYAGGKLGNPSYMNIGDHIETLQVDFDPQIIRFDEIAGIFWNSHNPFEPYWKRQYANAIYYHNKEQKEILERQIDSIVISTGKPVKTEIIEFEKFYNAENYHQKYHLQCVNLLIREYRNIFGNIEDFVNSTSAARVNGYVRGYGKVEDFDRNLIILGISEESLMALKNIFYKYKKKVV